VAITIQVNGEQYSTEADVVRTVSRALLEEVGFDRSKVTGFGWDDYPIIRFTDAPTVDVISIEQPTLHATGSGGPSCNPIAPAVANAVSDAAGIRLRSLPTAPDRVKAALGVLS
jgi:CO/xanthine dehydrogenase Mo-binding subunit